MKKLDAFYGAELMMKAASETSKTKQIPAHLHKLVEYSQGTIST